MRWLLSLFRGGRTGVMRRITTTLPPLLRERFGSTEFYTTGQVLAVCRAKAIDEVHWPIALAALCDRATFVGAGSYGGDAEYDALRTELVERCGISRTNFTVEDLAKAAPRSAAWSPTTVGE